MPVAAWSAGAGGCRQTAAFGTCAATPNVVRLLVAPVREMDQTGLAIRIVFLVIEMGSMTLHLGRGCHYRTRACVLSLGIECEVILGQTRITRIDTHTVETEFSLTVAGRPRAPPPPHPAAHH